jgi:hypothetical protein
MKTYGFSLKRLMGVTSFKTKISRATGIPLTKTGRQAKIGRIVLKMFTGGR